MSEKLYQWLYRLSPPPPRVRPANKPMEVLALGLPRSGTDSLRVALLDLGYSKIWHGFDLPANRPNDSAIWVPLLQAKERGDDRPGRDFNWDVLLGDCDGVMDMPPGIFAEDLIDFYPGAKVILNRRRNMDDWHRSLSEAADLILGNWLVLTLSFWDAELYWWFRSAVLWMGIMGGPGQDFKRNGKEWAERYYERLEEKLKSEGREYLNWDVQQGWLPLCKFLDKPVPDQDFPWMNKGGGDFEENANKALEKMVKRAIARITITIALVSGAIAVWWWMF